MQQELKKFMLSGWARWAKQLSAIPGDQSVEFPLAKEEPGGKLLAEVTE